MIHLILQIFRSAKDEYDRVELEKIRADALEKRTERVYDAETGSMKTIPAREMPAGMAQQEIPGLGLVWARPGVRNPQGLLRGPFPPEALAVVREIKEALDEVLPQPLEKWEEGFRKVPLLQAELAKWLRIADAYKDCTQKRRLSPEAKQDYYKVVYTCSKAPREQILGLVRLSAISQGEAREAVARYFDHRK